jgi:arginyl-tRNA synthetase
MPQDEWRLFFHYVVGYWALLAECIDKRDGHLADVATHKVTAFLSRLASMFSSYYNRVRILATGSMEPSEQAWARFYLAKALRVVYADALSLLAIPLLEEI